MKKTGIISLILAITVLFSFCSQIYAAKPEAVDTAISSCIDYYKNVQKETYESSEKFGTLFHIMMRAETNMQMDSDFLFLIPMYNISNVASLYSTEDLAKVIINCTMSGQDVKKIAEGYDVVSKLTAQQGNDGRFVYTDTDGIVKYSVAGQIWAIFALDMINEDYNRDNAVYACLNDAKPGGGFGEAESEIEDLDTTAIAAIAFSKYKNSDVLEIRDGCINCIKRNYINGIFNNNKTDDNAITQSLCIMAMIASGEAIWNEPYTTEKISPADFLLKLQNKDGGFSKFLSDKKSDDYSSALAMCALLDMKNTRSYLMNVGEKFEDTTVTDDIKDPGVEVIQYKAIAIVCGGLLLIFATGYIIGAVANEKKRKKTL